jgi:hypothetical protein
MLFLKKGWTLQQNFIKIINICPAQKKHENEFIQQWLRQTTGIQNHTGSLLQC